MSREYVVTSQQQLLAIAAPGREEIVDAVGLLGPCTVPDLARFLGRTRHALYYHVRALRDCGLLLKQPPDGPDRPTTARYDVPGRPMVVRYDLATPRGRRAVAALAQSRLRSAARGFARACDPAIAVTEGPRRNLWVAHWKGWLSEAELEQVNALLARLIDLFRHERGARAGRRPHEITFAITPVTSTIGEDELTA